MGNKRQSMHQGAGAKERAAIVWSKTEGRCWYCGEFLLTSKEHYTKTEQLRWFVIDHVMPLNAGGDDGIDNLVPACWSCNSAKRSMTLEEYRAHAGRILAGIPKFSQEQIEYLASLGLVLPELPPHVFWGEQIP